MKNDKRIYKVQCESAWDGDDSGNQWKCGVAVYPPEDGCPGYAVFEDDGEGNGTHLESFESLFDARRYADLYAKFLDEGGYSGSSTHIDMCRLSEARALNVPGSRQWSASNPG